jgi:hypothetical protein
MNVNTHMNMYVMHVNTHMNMHIMHVNVYNVLMLGYATKNIY